jgi:hypothetical protein
MLAPNRYFQIEARQDSRRLEACKSLIYKGDIKTLTWTIECYKLENAALKAEVRTRLRNDLQNAISLVARPWPFAV